MHVITSPRITGFDRLLANLCAVASRWVSAAQVLVVAFDLDGQTGVGGRPDKRARVEAALSACGLPNHKVVLWGAHQELEVYALWGQRSALSVGWVQVRTEIHPKEVYFDGFISATDSLTVDGGRARLVAASLSSGWSSLRSGCSELQDLEDDVRRLL